MATVAKSSITLTSVSDAYSALLSAYSCVINSDYDGSNPQLSNAYTIISVTCGESNVPITVNASEITKSVDIDDIQFSLTKLDDYRYKLAITGLPLLIREGYFDIPVHFSVDSEQVVRFAFTIVRESTMLDWIQEWENGKTKIGDSYIITPKLFVGKKITGDHETLQDVDGLTGVYIGPSNEDSAGVYGYKAGLEIFHLDDTGGSIGGWDITSNGIQSPDGTLTLLSEGSIKAVRDGVTYWQLLADGSASFAKGNVVMSADGSASFEGKITSNEGSIGGWNINSNAIYKDGAAINSASHYFAIANTIVTDGDYLAAVKKFGGAAMFYISAADYGFVAYKVATCTFMAGATNFIAGWSFDSKALYLGTKNNNADQYTSEAGSITIGTNGLRGYSWYINTDGSASFANGFITFDSTSATISGWNLTKTRLASAHAVLASDTSYAGLYLSVGDFIDGASTSNLVQVVSTNGGIYMYSDGANTKLAGYNKDGKYVFLLNSHGANIIGGWNFTNSDIYTGTLSTEGFTTDAKSLTLSTSGLRGYKWYLNPDGSGAMSGGNILWDNTGAGSIANGKISWDENGVLTFDDSVKLLWGEGITASEIMAYGTMLYRDPEFSSGYNDTKIYIFNRIVTLKVGDYLTFLQTNGIKLRGSVRITKIRIKGTDTTLWSGAQWLTSQSAQFVEADALSDLDSSSVLVFEGDGEEGEIIMTDDVSADYYLCGDSDDNPIGTTSVNMARSIIDDETAPNGSGKVLNLNVYRWRNASDLRLGGFAFANDSKANGQFLVRIVANIPIGWKIKNYHNAYGDNATTKWLTSQSGTGEYTEYMCMVNCGSSGSFSTINHFALAVDDNYRAVGTIDDDTLSIRIQQDGSPAGLYLNVVTWKVAFATVYDGTSSDKVTTTIDKNGIYTGTLRADQIVAGTIQSELIDTDNLIVQHIIAGDSDGEHVEIDPKVQQVAIYDADGVLGTALSGKTYSDGVDGIYKDVDKGTVDLTPTTGSNSIQKGTFESSNTTGTKTYMPTLYSTVWYSKDPVCITFNAGKIVVSATSIGYQETSSNNSSSNQTSLLPSTLESSQKSMASAYVCIKLQVADDINFTQNVKSYNIWQRTASACSSDTVTDSSNHHPTVTYSNVSSSSSATDSLITSCMVKSQTKGYHRIVMTGYVQAKMSGSKASITWGSSYSGGANLAATYINEFYVSRYFANGFCLGISASQYVSVWKDASDKMHFKAEESGYGLMLSDQGLQYKHHSGNWIKMPLLVWKGTITCSSSSSSTSYYTNKHLSFNGATITSVTRKTNSDDSNISKNHIHLVCAFPDSWNTLDLSVSNAIVNLTGYGDTMMKGTLVSISNTSMTIEISDDSSANDGDLMIEIYTIA